MHNTTDMFTTIYDLETGSSYVEESFNILSTMSEDMYNMAAIRAIALEGECYELADALEPLETLYQAALDELLTGDHSALQAAMEALQAAVIQVTTILTQY